MRDVVKEIEERQYAGDTICEGCDNFIRQCDDCPALKTIHDLITQIEELTK